MSRIGASRTHYLRLSRQSRRATPPATIHAAPLSHIGTGRPPTLTSSRKGIRNRCASATNPNMIVAVIAAGFMDPPPGRNEVPAPLPLVLENRDAAPPVTVPACHCATTAGRRPDGLKTPVVVHA